MKLFIVMLLLLLTTVASYYDYIHWIVPCIIVIVYVIGVIRHRNLAQLKQRKIKQTIQCCQAFGIPAEQVNAWFDKPQWQLKENYIDVHPGREAEAIKAAVEAPTQP